MRDNSEKMIAICEKFRDKCTADTIAVVGRLTRERLLSIAFAPQIDNREDVYGVAMPTFTAEALARICEVSREG